MIWREYNMWVELWTDVGGKPWCVDQEAYVTVQFYTESYGDVKELDWRIKTIWLTKLGFNDKYEPTDIRNKEFCTPIQKGHPYFDAVVETTAKEEYDHIEERLWQHDYDSEDH